MGGGRGGTLDTNTQIRMIPLKHKNLKKKKKIWCFLEINFGKNALNFLFFSLFCFILFYFFKIISAKVS